MNLEEIRKILEAEWWGREPAGDDAGRDVRSCHASDLMSDVLTLSGVGSLLLTGLANVQVIRVAEISDFAAVCFVRGKKPQAEAVQLAEEREIPMLVTSLPMFEACGRLYAQGLRGGDRAKEGLNCPRQR